MREVSFGPFNLGFFLRGGLGEDFDRWGVPSCMGLGEVVAVGCDEGLFHTEIASGDGFKVVLGRC